jgi:hypothetical protein
MQDGREVMADRTVTDTAGRTWDCVSAPTGAEGSAVQQGRDLVLTCATPSVSAPVNITVGWQWEGMSANGLARLINQASPVPRG